MIDKLTIAEPEIQNLLNQNEANWKDVAQIAIAVREKELFKQSGIKSFTAWVNYVGELPNTNLRYGVGFLFLADASYCKQ